MSYRSLNGLNGSNLIITNNYVARLPIEQTQTTSLDPVYIGLKGLSGMGADGQIMKVSNGVLAWATDNNEIITATLPLLKTNSDISLKGITAFGGAGKILKVNSNNDAFEWGTDTNDPSKWILTGTNLYPISTGTNVVIGTATNTDNRKLFVSGDAEVNNFYAKNILLNNGTTQSYIRFYDTDATSPEHTDLKATQGTTASNHTLSLPADITGTLAVANSTIAFGDGGGTVPIERSYIFDPRQNSGNPTLVYNVLSYHENGTESAINNWSAAEGELDSHFSINFAGAMKFRFHANGVLKVGSFSYTFPSSSGTLSKTTDVIPYNYGGTGFTTYTQGDIIYASATNTLSKLTAGANGNVLKMNATVPYWGTDTDTNYWSEANNTLTPVNTVNLLTTGNLTVAGMLIIGDSTTNLYIKSNNDVVMSYIRNTQQISLEGDTTIQGELNVKTHFQVYIDGFGSGNHILRDPNTNASNPTDYFLQYQTSGLNTVLNCASNSASAMCALYVGGTVKFGAYGLKTVSFVPMDINGNITMTAGDTVSFPRFKISQNGGITKINNPAGDNANAQRNIIEYHNDGTYLNLIAPSDGATDSNYISNYIGTALKLKIGGATTRSYNPNFSCASNHLVIQHTSSMTYLYNDEGTHTTNNGGEATAAGSYISYHDNGSAIYFNIPNGATAVGNYISFATGNSQKMRIEMAGNLYVCGAVYDGVCPSDSRLKHNEKVYDKNATDILNKIVIKDFMKSQIINFDDKDPDDTSKGMKPFMERLCPMEDCKYDIGVIAQELYEIPELSFMVDTEDWGEEKPATIPNWNPLISLLIKSNQEQQTKIIKLETELDIYKSIVDKLINSKTFADFKKNIA